jgi:hypothetical protein
MENMSLTNDDKNWIASAIASATGELSTQLTAAIERVETSLLTEFHKWASPMESRVRSHSLALRALDQETENSIDRDRKIAELEARVRKLEKAS